MTRWELGRDLRALGVREAGLLWVHTAMSSLGWVVGGEDSVVLALLDVLGHEGTLAAYAGWDEDPYHMASWPEDWKRAYREGLPPYDPATTVANHEHGRLPERIRTWLGSVRGEHPEANLVAIGPRAEWLVSPHPFDDACGPGTPAARFVEAEGQVLMLGAPLSSITLLHHAEAIVELPGKRRVEYEMPVLEEGSAVWKRFSDFETSTPGAFPYEEVLGSGVDAFEVIGHAALDAGCGVSGPVGTSMSHLFEAAALVGFAVRWLEGRFG